MVLSVEQRILHNVLDIESFARGTARRIVKIFDEAQLEGLKRLRKLDPDSEFTRRMLTGTLDEIDATLLRLQPKFAQILSKARRNVIAMEYAASAKALLRDTPSAEAILTRLPVERLRILLERPLGGHTLEFWTAKQNARMISSVKRELAKSLTLKESVKGASKRLVEGFGIKRSTADTIARSSLLQSGNDARDELFKRNDDFIKGYQYLATLDQRTCPICAPDDGRIASAREELPELLRHPNCRCTIVPITELSEPLVRPAVTEQELSKINRRDGSTGTKNTIISTKQTKQDFGQFFNSQPASWKREWLGEERYKLWRSGKLTDIGELATNRRTFTVAELKKRLGD